MSMSGAVTDVLVENNVFFNSSHGITAGPGVTDILLVNNTNTSSPALCAGDTFWHLG